LEDILPVLFVVWLDLHTKISWCDIKKSLL